MSDSFKWLRDHIEKRSLLKEPWIPIDPIIAKKMVAVIEAAEIVEIEIPFRGTRGILTKALDALQAARKEVEG